MTRDRDVEDARSALRRSGELLDKKVLENEIADLAAELSDVDVRGRWTVIQRPTWNTAREGVLAMALMNAARVGPSQRARAGPRNLTSSAPRPS